MKIDAHLEMIWKMKESIISKIYELSNNRIAIIKREEYCSEEEELKIYSLDTFKLISVTKFKGISQNIVELKNKDLVRSISSSLEFYKLSGQKYEFFQKIEEEKINIYSILGLMDGNLVSFNTNGIEIYSKEKDKYKSISKIKIEDTAKSGYEIEKNKLIIFKKKSKLLELFDSSELEQRSRDFVVSFFDLVNKEEKILVIKEFKENNEIKCKYEFLNFVKNDKYLFVNFQITKSYQEYWEPTSYKYGNLNRELDHWEINYLNVGIYNLSREKYLECEFEIPPIDERIVILCNYNNDLFIAKKGKIEKFGGDCYEGKDYKPSGDENELNLFKYEDKTFKSYRKLPFEIDDFETIIKLKNNNFIIYSKYEIKLYKAN